MRLELRREETRKAALHALIEEIVAYPDAMIEVKYRIRNRYRTASKAVEANHDLRVCTATAVVSISRLKLKSSTKQILAVSYGLNYVPTQHHILLSRRL